MIERPANDAPIWRWKLYNNWHGYSRTGKIVRAFGRDFIVGLAVGWSNLWRWLPTILVTIFLVKVFLR